MTQNQYKFKNHAHAIVNLVKIGINPPPPSKQESQLLIIPNRILLRNIGKPTVFITLAPEVSNSTIVYIFLKSAVPLSLTDHNIDGVLRQWVHKIDSNSPDIK